nr:PREDICTED: uncharacterized protein LOC105669046 [Linepithema humile]XP_012217208.1 PREDICTED: uncharacterized protein LOC105669046 [Linepithema humile]XP_012217209.1 PREDICTED: uncharacterized protein LOC105669046 [Linepithema humile]XP_012217210.1 PREDICTED: uncharacterized protein LOC105669046 [Linepithema humile]
MSGVGFLAAVKTFTPGGRRRRRCEKQQKVLELPSGYGMQPDVVPPWDAAPPITPPAAFLPPGYKKGFPANEMRGRKCAAIAHVSACRNGKLLMCARFPFVSTTVISKMSGEEKQAEQDAVSERLRRWGLSNQVVQAFKGKS